MIFRLEKFHSWVIIDFQKICHRDGIPSNTKYSLSSLCYSDLCRVLSKNWEIFVYNNLQDLLLYYVTWCVFGHDIFLSTARANEVSVLVIYHKFPQKALTKVFFQLRLGTVEVLELSPLPNSWGPLIWGGHSPGFPGLSLQLWSCSPNPHLEFRWCICIILWPNIRCRSIWSLSSSKYSGKLYLVENQGKENDERLKDQFKMHNEDNFFDHQYDTAQGGLNPEKNHKIRWQKLC